MPDFTRYAALLLAASLLLACSDDDGSGDAGSDTGPADGAMDAITDTSDSDSMAGDTSTPVDAGPPPSYTTSWTNLLVGDVRIAELQIDATDSSWYIGSFTGSFDQSGTTVTARADGTDVIVQVLGADGMGTRAHYLGGASADYGNGIDVDTTGRMLIGGGFEGMGTFGMNEVTSAGDLDAFVGSFDTASDLGPAFAFGGTGGDSTHDVAWAPDGSVTAVGTFHDTVDFGGTSLTSRGLADGFVVATAADGTVRWVVQVGGSGADLVQAVAHDGDGNVYVTGRVRDDADLGDGATTGGAMDDMFVAAYAAADGAHLWSARFGSDEGDWGSDILVDGEGMVAVTGEVGAELSFGGGLSAPGAFLARWRASDGMLMSERRFGAGRAHPASLRESSAGFLVSGRMDDGFLVAGVPFLPAGGIDAFVVRLPPSGTDGVDGFVFGGEMDDVAFGAVEASDGTVIAAASFEGETTVNGVMVTDADATSGAIIFAVTLD